MSADLRAGKIIGTAALFSIRARQPLGLLGPAPFDGELDDPTIGVVGGYGEFQEVDPGKPWKGGRWVVRTEAGQRFPLTLSMCCSTVPGQQGGRPPRTPRRAAYRRVSRPFGGRRSAGGHLRGGLAALRLANGAP